MYTKTAAPVNFWHLSADDMFHQLSSSKNGLNAQDAAERLKLYGANTMEAATRNWSIILFLSQFKSPITIMFIVAALLSAALGDIADTVIILVIVLISSMLGFWQEKGAANAVSELLKLVQLHCDLLRDGKNRKLQSKRLFREILFCFRQVILYRATTC